jgi:hypothetical protein
MQDLRLAVLYTVMCRFAGIEINKMLSMEICRLKDEQY